MDPGQTCTMSVDAKTRWNHTGVHLQAGQRYRLSAAGVWADRGKSCGPDGHDGDRWVFRLTGCLRRARRLPWFALAGAVGENLDTAFLIGSGTEISPSSGGELTCFANDVSVMYGNNSGSLLLTVTRTA